VACAKQGAHSWRIKKRNAIEETMGRNSNAGKLL